MVARLVQGVARPATDEVGCDRLWRVRPSDGGWSVTVEGTQLGEWSDPVEAARVVTSDLELWVAERSPRWTFIHAACVAIGDRALVLPGRSMAGKSTLATALVRAGATYYSDEYALLGPDGRVRPYARPLRLRQPEGWRAVEVSDLGGVAGRRPVPVGVIASLSFRPGLPLEVHPVGAGEAVLLLMANAVAARRRPTQLLTSTTTAVEGAVIVAGVRGEADEAAAGLLAMLRATVPPTP